MAKLILQKSGEKQEEEVADGSNIQEPCEDKFNIPFGCKDGICGTCRIKIIDGNKNLSEKNEAEEDMFPDQPDIRLACQCNIKKGKVIIDDSYD